MFKIDFTHLTQQGFEYLANKPTRLGIRTMKGKIEVKIDTYQLNKRVAGAPDTRDHTHRPRGNNKRSRPLFTPRFDAMAHSSDLFRMATI